MPTSKTATTPDAAPASGGQESVRDRLRNRTRPILALTICDNHAAQRALAEAQALEQRCAAAAEREPDNTTLAKALTEAKKRTAAAQQVVEAATIRLRFQALDRKTYRELRAAHPPTEEQADEGYDFNVDTLAPIVIAASSLDGITEEDAAGYLDDWSQAEAEALLNTAFAVQREERMDLGKG